MCCECHSSGKPQLFCAPQIIGSMLLPCPGLADVPPAAEHNGTIPQHLQTEAETQDHKSCSSVSSQSKVFLFQGNFYFTCVLYIKTSKDFINCMLSIKSINKNKMMPPTQINL